MPYKIKSIVAQKLECVNHFHYYLCRQLKGGGMDKWPEEKLMMKLAEENNLSETAFIVKEEAGYHLRWFTPGTEVELCGHATLASAFVMLNYYEKI